MVFMASVPAIRLEGLRAVSGGFKFQEQVPLRIQSPVIMTWDKESLGRRKSP